MLCAERINCEAKGITAVVISVEEDLNLVVVGKTRVAYQFAGVDARSIRIEGVNADVKIFIVKENPYLRFF